MQRTNWSTIMDRQMQNMCRLSRAFYVLDKEKVKKKKCGFAKGATQNIQVEKTPSKTLGNVHL